MIPLALLLAMPTQADVKTAMHDYFEGEEAGGAAFLAAGVAGGIGGAMFLLSRDDNDVLEGAAYPLLAVGAVQLVIGTILRIRTPSQVAELDALYATDQAKLVKQERDRMNGVMSGFGIYKWVELGLAAAGTGLAVYGGVDDRPILLGVGVGLAGEALLMLMLDWFAEERADAYVEALR